MADLYQSPLTSPLQGPLVPQTTTLTDGATIALDASLGDHFVVTLGGNRTLAAPTNPKGGQRITLAVIQDGTGSRTLTFNAAYDFNGATPSLNAAASAVTLFLFVYNPSTSKWVSVKVNTPVTTADLATGTASAGIRSTQLLQTAAVSAGAFTYAPSVPVVVELAIPDAAGDTDYDFTGLIGKHKVINCWVVTEAAGDASNTFTLKTSGGTAVTDAMAPAAAVGSIARAGSIAAAPTKIFADGSTLRVSKHRVGGSSLAKVYVELVPVA